jgi:glycosyltransferase involved in cell wall biosynthesis
VPLVSIIIPCYNQGNLIKETLDSVYCQTFTDYEVIVVNDGSTDTTTTDILNKLDFPRTKVIHTTNQGLASARNNGIKLAQSELILPLDSDDKIHPAYLEKAVSFLKHNPEYRIVYCKAMLFEKKQGIWNIPDYSLSGMLSRNLIFASAFFYKSDWEKAGGYNPNMIYGWEDWDFWLSLIEQGAKPFKLNEVLFYYRIRKGTMAKSITKVKQIKMRAQIFRNHQKLYNDNIEIFFERIMSLERSLIQRLKEDKFRLIRSFLKNTFSQQP